MLNWKENSFIIPFDKFVHDGGLAKQKVDAINSWLRLVSPGQIFISGGGHCIRRPKSVHYNNSDSVHQLRSPVTDISFSSSPISFYSLSLMFPFRPCGRIIYYVVYVARKQSPPASRIASFVLLPSLRRVLLWMYSVHPVQISSACATGQLLHILYKYPRGNSLRLFEIFRSVL